MSTILIVEDEPGYVEAYARWLDDYEVEIATDGSSALEQMGPHIDVVLLDRRLPDLSGREVLGKIREQGYDCRVAIVSAVEPEFEVLEMGFDDYLVKSVSEDELRSTVDRLIRLSEYNTDLQELQSLVAKKAALEESIDEPTLVESPEYAMIEAEIDRLQEKIDDMHADLAEDDPVKLFGLLDQGPHRGDTTTKS